MSIVEKTAEGTLAGLDEPTWDIAHLFPYQGAWSEDEYLALDTNRLVEFDHGYLEVLSMPDISHQRIVALLYRLLWNYVMAHKLGEVLFALCRCNYGPRSIESRTSCLFAPPGGKLRAPLWPRLTW